ncbi:MAG: hypothetical protein K1W16_10415 [Lachnospiraceae bacterium]
MKMNNNLQVFNNPELNLQIRTILNDDNSISVNLEDTAKGFTRIAKSGNEIGGFMANKK